MKNKDGGRCATSCPLYDDTPRKEHKQMTTFTFWFKEILKANVENFTFCKIMSFY